VKKSFQPWKFAVSGCRVISCANKINDLKIASFGACLIFDERQDFSTGILEFCTLEISSRYRA